MTIDVTPASQPVYFGIDVSKSVLDVCCLAESGKPTFSQFANTAAGHSSLLAWARKQSRHAERRFCMEATGSYGEPLATYLDDASEFVSVVNPAVVKYSGADGSSNKTDKADALKIARFARLHTPRPWAPPTAELRTLVSLVRHLDDLIVDQARYRARLADAGLDVAVRSSFETILKTVAEQIKLIERQTGGHLDAHPDLKADTELLETIPAVGRITALRIVVEACTCPDTHSAQSLAAYAGLSPREHKSGSSVRRPTRISKSGNRHLRKAMYMPAMCAIRCNPFVRALAERMKAAGKHRMAIVTAAMRKLLMIAYGVLKSRKPFDPSYKQGKPVCATSLTT